MDINSQLSGVELLAVAQLAAATQLEVVTKQDKTEDLLVNIKTKQGLFN